MFKLQYSDDGAMFRLLDAEDTIIIDWEVLPDDEDDKSQNCAVAELEADEDGPAIAVFVTFHNYEGVLKPNTVLNLLEAKPSKVEVEVDVVPDPEDLKDLENDDDNDDNNDGGDGREAGDGNDVDDDDK